jgi:hypothetical protein
MLSMRVYVKPKSKAEQAVAELLQAYGIKPSTGSDAQGPYRDFDLPEHWNRSRREKFTEAIQRATSK